MNIRIVRLIISSFHCKSTSQLNTDYSLFSYNLQTGDDDIITWQSNQIRIITYNCKYNHQT